MNFLIVKFAIAAVVTCAVYAASIPLQKDIRIELMAGEGIVVTEPEQKNKTANIPDDIIASLQQGTEDIETLLSNTDIDKLSTAEILQLQYLLQKWSTNMGLVSSATKNIAESIAELLKNI
ncbi:uncharacterized protein LOC120331410 [Styela clava]